jgi:hypothetical protein
LERLDDRTVLSTFSVLNLADSGLGSLRQAIAEASAHGGADVIDFDRNLRGTIPLSSGQLTITDALTIDGPGASVITVRGDDTFSVFEVAASATVAISGLTIAHIDPDTGVGISNWGMLTLDRSTLSGNSGFEGGGLSNQGTATVTGCTFSDNYAGWSGSALYNFGTGTLALDNSTVSGNRCADAFGSIGSEGATIITSSTIAQNTGFFGGIWTAWEPYVGTLQIRNTIVAGNSGDVAGDIVSLGHNLIGVDPRLGPLQDNGGPTFTHALLPGSPAIDAGDNTDAPPYDQRGIGFDRIVNGVIDIGAYELQSQARTIGDAGFEQVSVGAGRFQYRPTGSPWTFTGSSGLSGNGSGFTAGNPPAPEGMQVAFLQQAGSFRQIVAGVAAGTYQISFMAAQRGNYQASKQDFLIRVDDQVVGSFTPAGTAYAGYATATFALTAGEHTITFVGVDSAGGDNTAFIDAVSLDRIPPTRPIADAGFERPYAGPAGAWGSFLYRPTGSAWTYAGAAGVAANSSGFTAGNPGAPEGAQVAFLQQTGSFSQVVTGWEAGTYQISFKAAQRGNYQASAQDFQVLIDGARVGGVFTPAGTAYAGYATATFVVTAGDHTISFQGLDSRGGDNTAFIDDIRVTRLLS